MAKSKKKKTRRNVSRGIAHVQSTFNNTIVTITDTNGDTLCHSSGGAAGLFTTPPPRHLTTSSP